MSVKYTDEEVYTLIGKKIVELRESRGLRQIDLATQANIEDSALRRIEAGKTNPTTKTLLNITRVLDVPMKELFDY